jgi:HNH endonuclease
MSLRTKRLQTCQCNGQCKRGTDGYQGMNWLRQDKRLAIYLRDGLACVYCGASMEDGARLTLDHVIAHSRGGSDDATNVVTCCATCNSSRGNKILRTWARPAAIVRVRHFTRQPIVAERVEAKKLIARRGSLTRVLAVIR